MNEVIEVGLGPVWRLRALGKPTGWNPIENELLEGIQPEWRHIAVELRAGTPGMPPIVREHIADILDGKVKRRRGRKPEHPHKDLLALILIDARVEGARQEIAAKDGGGRGRGTPFEQALIQVAEELAMDGKHIAPSTLGHRIAHLRRGRAREKSE